MRSGDVSLWRFSRGVLAPALLAAAMFALAGCGSIFSSDQSGGGGGGDSTFSDLID